jgi:hypothetical protein
VGAERYYNFSVPALSVYDRNCMCPRSERFRSRLIVINMLEIIFLFKYKQIQSTLRVSWRFFAPTHYHNVALNRVVLCSVRSSLICHELSSFSSRVGQ